MPKNFNPNPKLIAAIVLGGGIIGKLAYDSIYEENFLNYNDFVKDYLDKGAIDKITIHRVTDGSHYKTYASIFTKDGDRRKLVLGNVDHFLENLEKH
jgi:AFG3 family protein